MSLITNVVILGACLEQGKEKTKIINKWLNKNGHGSIVEIGDSVENPRLGGEKVFTSYCLIGCFNYLDINKFLLMLKNINWEWKEHIRILLDNENYFGDNGYKQFKIADIKENI